MQRDNGHTGIGSPMYPNINFLGCLPGGPPGVSGRMRGWVALEKNFGPGGKNGFRVRDMFWLLSASCPGSSCLPSMRRRPAWPPPRSRSGLYGTGSRYGGWHMCSMSATCRRNRSIPAAGRVRRRIRLFGAVRPRGRVCGGFWIGSSWCVSFCKV